MREESSYEIYGRDYRKIFSIASSIGKNSRLVDDIIDNNSGLLERVPDLGDHHAQIQMNRNFFDDFRLDYAKGIGNKVFCASVAVYLIKREHSAFFKS